MSGGKSSLCCCDVGCSLKVGGLNMLLSHTAWHIALISSCTDASGPKQTHTQPEINTAELKTHTVYVIWLLNTLLFCGGRWKTTCHFVLPIGKACCFPSKPNSVPLGYKIISKIILNCVKLLLCVIFHHISKTLNYLCTTSCSLTPSLIGTVFLNSGGEKNK